VIHRGFVTRFVTFVIPWEDSICSFPVQQDLRKIHHELKTIQSLILGEKLRKKKIPLGNDSGFLFVAIYISKEEKRANDNEQPSRVNSFKKGPYILIRTDG
jgi:hypothetical protein